MTLAHVVDGDVLRDALAAAGIPGAVAVWADVLHDGPLVEDHGGDEAWRARRAASLSITWHLSESDVLATLALWDRGVERAATAGETVLWCEPDLFDQLILVRHLARVARGTWRPRVLTLVCRAAHPEVGDCRAFGVLSGRALTLLFDERERVTEAAVALAAAAWSAVCSPVPTRVNEVLRGEGSALPFLMPALERFLAEYPDREDGLSLTERYILQALDPCPLEGVRLFRAVQRLEHAVFMGDTSFFAHLRRMVHARTPLVGRTQDPSGGDDRHARFGLTAAGAAILRGEGDAVELNGLDRWIGGVHLVGDGAGWRWDRTSRSVTIRP